MTSVYQNVDGSWPNRPDDVGPIIWVGEMAPPIDGGYARVGVDWYADPRHFVR